uniref:Uncharacterized protein n=1 Tax=Trichuris muris TaxID=70415 RepID=A0A5S6Q645_TRIMR
MPRAEVTGIPRSASSSLKFGVGEEDYSKSKSPWIFKRLCDWSQRAKAREIIRPVRYALESEDSEYVNEDLNLTPSAKKQAPQ